MDQQTIDKVFDLYRNDEFDKAIEILSPVLGKNRKDVIANYYMGLIYTSWLYKNRSDEKAQQYLGIAIDQDKTIPEAFIEYAKLEENLSHKIRILKNGLEKFPLNKDLYLQLLLSVDLTSSEKIIKEIRAKKLTSPRLENVILDKYFQNKDYDSALKQIEKIKSTSNKENNILQVIEGFCLYENNQLDSAEKLFIKLIEGDIKNNLEYCPYYGLFLVYIKKNKVNEAIKIFSEIKFTEYIDTILLDSENYLSFTCEQYFLKSVDEAAKVTKDAKTIARAKGLKSIFTYNGDFSKYKNEDTVMKQVKKGFEIAKKAFPLEISIYTFLNSIYLDEKEGYSAYQNYLDCYEKLNKEVDSLEDILVNVSDNDLTIITTDFFKICENNGFLLSKLQMKMLDAIIYSLHIKEKYTDIYKLTLKFDLALLLKLNHIFEIAYSYPYDKDTERPKKLYEEIVKKSGYSSAVANNLGLIYQYQKDFLKAKELFEKSLEIDPGSKNAKNNLKIVNEEINKIKKDEKELFDTLQNFRKENIYIREKIFGFSEHSNEDGLIICPYKQLPQYFKISETKATELLNDFLSKKYILKVKEHNLETTASVYKINPFIVGDLDRYKEEMSTEEEYIVIANNLNTSKLRELGLYDLTALLSKITSLDLRIILERDLKENALALITNSYKSSIVLSGTIIEAVLLDKLKQKGVSNYLVNNKKIRLKDMRLDDMLYVAEKETIISNENYHLAHALRIYRNLIHPTIEERKKAQIAIPISKSKAEMIWVIMKNILNEI